MTKTINFLCYLFMLFSFLVRSQPAKTIDSLTQLVSAQEGIELAKTFNELSWEYMYTNDSLAIAYAKKAEELSNVLDYAPELATSYIRQGTIYLINNRLEVAKENLNKALALEEKEQNLSGIGRAKIQLAILYRKQQDYNKAIVLYNECLLIQKRLNSQKKIARIYRNIAVLYKTKNEPIKALEYYHKSIDLSDSIQDTKGLIKAYKNLGAFYNDQKQYQKAIIILEKGRKLCIALQDSIQLSSILLNLGGSYNDMKKLDTAFTYFKQSLVIKEKLGIKKLAPIYNNIGSVEEMRDHFDKAIAYYQKSIAIAQQNKNELQLIDTYHNIGRAYKKKKQYSEALDYYFKALALAKKHKREYRVLDILSGIGKVYELSEDYQNASRYNEEHIVIRNQLEKQARQHEAAMQLLSEERNKNKILKAEKATATAEIKRKTTQLIALITGCILLTLLFFTLFRSYRLKKQNQLVLQKEKTKQAEIEELLKSQELKSIHAMIDGQEKERKRIAQDLHDRLGSMLSVVKIHYKSVEENLEKMKSDAKGQYDQANKLLDEACVAVREISHNMVSGVLTKFGLIPALQELKNNVENAAKIEVELIDYGFDDRVDNELEISIYRIVQELIGNILKHANATEISIQLLKKEAIINITVIDNGDGFDTTHIHTFSGMGIKGIQSRVENLNGEVLFDSGRGNGTTVTIDIPKNL
ncbi:tetratricopeptide repeat protein [Aquimarina sp. RZ0]|uniref:tetratricopeptide repeat-containing sensor histidine kinase n=1 Tax=Aquimarina sp. RZ0 TaxID=2607730 RepID=UPI0011F390E2|nr:tetratricopeptide repeat protein [Aquimarina sp. RZ0]KAA1245863.1 tetratricopeptide repeat protein [Aquimarina sp. RZ0]